MKIKIILAMVVALFLGTVCVQSAHSQEFRDYVSLPGLIDMSAYHHFVRLDRHLASCFFRKDSVTVMFLFRDDADWGKSLRRFDSLVAYLKNEGEWYTSDTVPDRCPFVKVYLNERDQNPRIEVTKIFTEFIAGEGPGEGIFIPNDIKPVEYTEKVIGYINGIVAEAGQKNPGLKD